MTVFLANLDYPKKTGADFTGDLSWDYVAGLNIHLTTSSHKILYVIQTTALLTPRLSMWLLQLA